MFAEGRLLLERVRAVARPQGPRRTPSVVDAAIDAATDTRRPVAARLAVLQADDLADVLRPAPAARPGQRRGPLPGVRRPRARALRQLVRVLPALGGRDQGPETGRSPRARFRTAAKRLAAVAAMGFDVDLPAADPPDRPRSTARAPTTPSPRARTTPARPWAIGGKEGGHDAIHPDLGTMEDFDAFVARADELGLEVALDFALQCAPDHPWVTSTRSGSPRAPTARSPTPRTRRRSTRTSTRSTSTTTRGHLQGGAAGRPALDGPRRADLPRRQPAHQAGGVLGVAARRGPQDRPGRDLPVRGVHPAGDDARPRRGGLPPDLHLLHLAHRQAGARGLPPRALAARPTT